MKNKLSAIVILVVFILLIGGAYLLYNNWAGTFSPGLVEAGNSSSVEDKSFSDNQNQNQDNFSAPDFTVIDESGQKVTLSEMQGKPVVLNFWASWCPPCKSEMPDFDRAYTEYGEKITFIMVNLTDGARETVETAQAYITQQKYSFPVYFDTEYSAATAYGVSSIPATYFIDANGKMVAYGLGALDKDSLYRGLKKILPSE